MINYSQIGIEENKSRIAIVVVGYNRKNCLSRLLDSLDKAVYPSDEIPLVISIDASGDQDVYDFVRDFKWNHGEKYVNIQEKRLGLRDHIFQCGDLSNYFRAVTILEDDLFVSPYFYDFVLSAVDKYENEDRVGEIALYSPEISFFAGGIDFQPMKGSYDVYAWQNVETWGEVFTKKMWNGFRNWLENFDDDFSKVNVYDSVINWSKAWSKYLYAYLILENKTVIYPCDSMTTNFNDEPGVHGTGDFSNWQTALLMSPKEYRLGDLDQLVKYDVYGANLDIYDWLGIDESDLFINLFGKGTNKKKARFILTISNLPYKVIKSFGLAMRPIEQNIRYDIQGHQIKLYDTTIPAKQHEEDELYDLAKYYIGKVNISMHQHYVLKYHLKKIISNFFRN